MIFDPIATSELIEIITRVDVCIHIGGEIGGNSVAFISCAQFICDFLCVDIIKDRKCSWQQQNNKNERDNQWEHTAVSLFRPKAQQILNITLLKIKLFIEGIRKFTVFLCCIGHSRYFDNF